MAKHASKQVPHKRTDRGARTKASARKPIGVGGRGQHRSRSNLVCSISDVCGACDMVEMPYSEQLKRKEQLVRDLYADLLEPDTLMPILGMEHPFGFRDKIASPFAPDRRAMSRAKAQRTGRASKHPSLPREAIRCGLYAAGTHRIISVKTCPVEHPVGRKVVLAVQQLMARYGVAPYDEDRQSGFMRYVVVRVGHESREVLVTLVTASDVFPGAKNFCRELVRLCPEITSIVQNINPHVTNAILGMREQVLFGPGFILDTLCGLSFRISSHSFYQVNATQTEALYNQAMDFARLDDFVEPMILDAYCGTGTIGLVAASKARQARIIGVDNISSAIEDAKGNARHNGLGNAAFITSDASDFMRQFAVDGKRADIVFMDPPRAGSTPEFIASVGMLAPKRIVYISCNPRTQVRDVRMIMRHGYRLEKLRPVDMFPHTSHVECIALLSQDQKGQ
ncbi:MAG: 23S rRNA (uracil(1939)-C(5))-methyltransferase RlmD [Eggerthellaceae bacterium]|jgi:23S rRNA (uracil1939-C5)-methyltransferase